MLTRRTFLQTATVSTAASLAEWRMNGFCAEVKQAAAPIGKSRSGEDVFNFVIRTTGQFDRRLYLQVLGAANEFKEGDQSVGIAAVDDLSRINARRMLGETTLAKIDAHPLIEDNLAAFNRSAVDARARSESAGWTLGRLKEFLLLADEAIYQIDHGRPDPAKS